MGEVVVRGVMVKWDGPEDEEDDEGLEAKRDCGDCGRGDSRIERDWSGLLGNVREEEGRGGEGSRVSRRRKG